MERKLRDSWAKWHNIILKWDELTLDLFHRLQKFLNTRTQLDYYTAPSLHALQAVSGVRESALHKLTSELALIMADLGMARKKYLKLAGDMETLTQELTSCEELLISQSGEWSPYSPHPIFPTCTTSHFRLVSERLTLVYRKELQIKMIVLRELPETKVEELRTLYLTSWSCEPFLDGDLTLDLQLIIHLLGLK